MTKLASILLTLLCAGCGYLHPGSSASPFGSAAIGTNDVAIIMPPVNHVALASTMVASTVVFPLKPATVTLSANVTNRVTVESSTDLKTWGILTNGFLPMTFPASQLCQYFRLASNTVQLAWDASPDVTVAGYKIYQGRESHEYTKAYDVGNVLTCRVPVFIGLNTFAATCYDSEGSESDFSNEAAWTNQPATLKIQ